MKLTEVPRGAPGAQVMDGGDLNPLIHWIGDLELLWK